MISSRLAVFVATSFLLASPGAAAPPALVPVQGFLADAGGTPLTGTFDVTLSVYAEAAGGAPVWTETRSVTVDRGAFTVYLGSGAALDLQVFEGGQAWLGIQVGSDAEMAPRLQFATVPYAAHAGQAEVALSVLPSGNGVPAGAVMYFDLASCPVGWTAYAGARGRTIVGVPSGGTLGAQVAVAYGNAEDRAHAHAVDVAATTSASAAAHTHDVNPAAVTSASYTHNHLWSIYDDAAVWHSFTSTGDLQTVIDWSDGMNTDGSGNYPLARDGVAYTPFYTQNNAHAHSVDVAATTSTSTGAHAHAVDPAAVTSASASGLVPYVQLLACRKD